MGEDGQVTPPARPDIAFAREKAKRSLPVSLLVLFGIVAMYLPLPRRFVAAVPLIAAVVLTVRLLRFLKNRARREKLWPVLTLGLVGAMLATLVLQAVLYDQVHSYEQCLAGALTQQAKADCERLHQTDPLGSGFILE